MKPKLLLAVIVVALAVPMSMPSQTVGAREDVIELFCRRPPAEGTQVFLVNLGAQEVFFVDIGAYLQNVRVREYYVTGISPTEGAYLFYKFNRVNGELVKMEIETKRDPPVYEWYWKCEVIRGKMF
jgi:hypothetical protein